MPQQEQIKTPSILATNMKFLEGNIKPDSLHEIIYALLYVYV